MTPDSTLFWVIAASACGILMVGFTLFARMCSFSPAVKYQKLDQLRVGMNMNEVVALLGEPRERKPGEERVQTWYYGARWKRHMLVLEFAPDGRLQSFAHGAPNERHSGQTRDS
jgi:outer membrane protein assembly factor BamE (lipoprotein component of BamABCDE complex)